MDYIGNEAEVVTQDEAGHYTYKWKPIAEADVEIIMKHWDGNKNDATNYLCKQ